MGTQAPHDPFAAPHTDSQHTNDTVVSPMPTGYQHTSDTAVSPMPTGAQPTNDTAVSPMPVASQHTSDMAISPMPEMQSPPDYAGQEQYYSEKEAQPQQITGYNEKEAQPNQPIYSNGAPPLPEQGGPPRSQYAAATPIGSLQSSPSPIDCPFCGARELTKCEFISGGTTHGTAALLCCCFCLGCIPYIGSWLKDCEQRCGNCNTMVAVWHRSGRTEVLVHPQQPQGRPQ